MNDITEQAGLGAMAMLAVQVVKKTFPSIGDNLAFGLTVLFGILVSIADTYFIVHTGADLWRAAKSGFVSTCIALGLYAAARPTQAQKEEIAQQVNKENIFLGNIGSGDA